MAHLRPFSATRFARRMDLEISKLIAPPFDVLDENAKAALQAAHPNNIVTIDLPHIPPKAAGPFEKYEQANATFDAWLENGTLVQDRRPALYPYTQTFEKHGRTYHRRGFYALVRLAPFGQGQVVPHEKTYKGAIEDRLALMRAMRVQMSPIFGIYSDPRNEMTSLLYHSLARPEMSGTLDGVKHDLWSVIDAEVENHVIDFMGTRPIYIADGHHRYTTALTYQLEMEAQNGGPLPPKHPANYCLFVLIGMQDDGLLILPTHRMIGNLTGFENADVTQTFIDSLTSAFDVQKMGVSPENLAVYANDMLSRQPAHTFGFYVGSTRTLYQLSLKNVDILQPLEPDQSESLRRLDVSILQRYLLDEVLQKYCATGELKKTYTADATQIADLVDGNSHQVAVLLQPTPLHALEDLAKHNEVMPQKSTYFYPKLATGLVMNSLRS